MVRGNSWATNFSSRTRMSVITSPATVWVLGAELFATLRSQYFQKDEEAGQVCGPPQSRGRGLPIWRSPSEEARNCPLPTRLASDHSLPNLAGRIRNTCGTDKGEDM